MIRIRAVPADRGWHWIVEGFRLFRRSAFMWMLLTLVLLICWMLLLTLPRIGILLFHLLFPVFAAGFVIGCRDLEQGKPLELAHVFAGFRTHAATLVTVGGVYLVGLIVVRSIVYLSPDSALVIAAVSRKDVDAVALVAAVRRLTPLLMVSLALYVPLLMAVWLAPVLIAFHAAPAIPAMKLSFQAFWRNILACTVYGAIVLAVWIVAMIPLLLGFLIALPLLFCSMYASYKDLFEDDARVTNGTPAVSG